MNAIGIEENIQTICPWFDNKEVNIHVITYEEPKYTSMICDEASCKKRACNLNREADKKYPEGANPLRIR